MIFEFFFVPIFDPFSFHFFWSVFGPLDSWCQSYSRPGSLRELSLGILAHSRPGFVDFEEGGAAELGGGADGVAVDLPGEECWQMARDRTWLVGTCAMHLSG